MRITKKILIAKVERYNSIATVKVKLNDDVIGGINLYTENNNIIATGKYSEIALVLDALFNIKALEQ